MMRKKNVCLVTPGKLSCNPRLVKEADALVEAGFEVQVVYGILGPLDSEQDVELLRTKPWKEKARQVNPGGINWLLSRGLSKLTRKISTMGNGNRPVPFPDRHHSPLIPALSAVTIGIRADLYLGHYLAGLVAAGRAAARNHALLGFDAEDAHHVELEGNSIPNRRELQARVQLEREWLPGCSHLTAASPLISESYQLNHHVNMKTVLNVFPLMDAPGFPPGKINPSPNLYWFSQKIGPGRGIEKLIHILEHLDVDTTLSLRGTITGDFRRHLTGLTRRTTLSFLPPVGSTDLVKSSQDFNAGLCIELSTPPHRDACLTNKIFTYLLAGIPIILSRTRAHEMFIKELGNAAIMVDINDPDAATRTLGSFLTSPELQIEARNMAWDLGRNRFNWDIEKARFLESVETAFSRGSVLK